MVAKAVIISNGTTLGAQASVSCEDGYTLHGSGVFTCNNSGWQGEANCTIKGKSKTVTQLNSQYDGLHPNSYLHMHTVGVKTALSRARTSLQRTRCGFSG